MGLVGKTQSRHSHETRDITKHGNSQDKTVEAEPKYEKPCLETVSS